MGDETPESAAAEIPISQTSYEPSGYADASWEVVGEVATNSDFRSMEIRVLSSSELGFDPMFRDYGGVPKEKTQKRWHLPAHLAYRDEASAAEEIADPKAVPQSLTEYDLERIRAEAFAQGREEALAESAATQIVRIERIENSIQTLVKDLSVQLREEASQMEKQAVELSVQIAQRIINAAVEINPEYIVEIVHEALTLGGSAKIRKIRVSPQDFEFLEYAGIRKKLHQVEGNWDFEADAAIRSGCVLESSAGEVNFELDKAWERARDNIVRVIR